MGDENDDQTNNGHPAWAELLEVVPQEFHPLITPKLQEWDNGVKQRLEEVNGRYSPYKELLDQNIDPEFITGAVGLATQLQSEPDQIVSQLIEAFGLDFVPKGETVSTNSGEPQEDPFAELGIDITQHPAFVAQQQALQQFQERFNAMDQQTEQEKQAEEVKKYLDSLETTHGSFDRLYVTALLTQGVNGEAAVKQYQDTVNQAVANALEKNNLSPAFQQQQQSSVPVVMGTDGGAGSGLAAEPFNFGEAKNSDVNRLVVEMLKSQQSNT